MAGEGEYAVEFPVVWPDETTHWLWSKGRFYFDAAGQPDRVAGIQMDITQRRATGEALRESEERLKLVLKGSRDAPWDLDLRTNVPYFSRRWLEMLGHPADRPPSDTTLWVEGCHPEDTARVQAIFQAALAGSQDTYAPPRRPTPPRRTSSRA